MLFAPNFIVLLLAAVILGSSQGILNNILNSFVNNIAAGKASAMTLLHACYSTGCTLTPFVVLLAIKGGFSWTITIWFCIMFCFVSMIGGIQIPHSGKFKHDVSRPGMSWHCEGRYYLLTALLFMAVGIQNGITGWSTTYFVEMKLLSKAGSQQLLSLLWIAMIGGRLICGFLSKFVSGEKLLTICCGGTFLILFCSLFFRDSPCLVLLLITASLFLSGIYPLAVSGASVFLLHNASASGFMFSLSGLGGVAAAYLLGFVSERTGMRNSILVTFIINFCAFIIALTNLYWVKSGNKKAKI
jgi:fucose permease